MLGSSVITMAANKVLVQWVIGCAHLISTLDLKANDSLTTASSDITDQPDGEESRGNHRRSSSGPEG